MDISQNPRFRELIRTIFEKFVQELAKIQKGMNQMDDKRKATLVDALKQIKITSSEGEKAKDSPELVAALKEAKEATAKHGITSKEARLAWETYEEIASSGLDNAIGVNLTEECQVDSGAEACQAMEALEQILPILQVAIGDKN